MKPTILIAILLILSNGCKDRDSTGKLAWRSDKECLSRKTEIQKAFDLKDYSKTIELFVPFKDCYNDESEYLKRLGLLYYVNRQDSSAEQTFRQLFERIDNEKEMSGNEIALYKGAVYMIQEKQDDLRLEIQKIDRAGLTESQKKELEYLELYANQGEFITASTKVEFELFE